jgi:hypothetical protein
VADTVALDVSQLRVAIAHDSLHARSSSMNFAYPTMASDNSPRDPTVIETMSRPNVRMRTSMF